MISTGNGDGELGGTLEVPLVNGWANFTDLNITRPGSGKSQFSHICLNMPTLTTSFFFLLKNLLLV